MMGQSFPNVSDRLFLLSHPKFWILILDFWGKEKVFIFGERGFLRRERGMVVYVACGFAAVLIRI